MSRSTVVVCMSLLAGACGGGGSSPVAPFVAPAPIVQVEPPLVGSWFGTVVDNLYVPRGGHADVSMTEWSPSDDVHVIGVWHMTDDHGMTMELEFQGEATATSFTARVGPDYPLSCGFVATATVSGNRMTGKHGPSDPAAMGCATIAGTFELTRQ